MNITKNTYKKALENRRILIVGDKYTSNGWTEFRIYQIIPAKNGLSIFKQIQAEDGEDVAYWNRKNWNWKCVAWGTDRRLEIILSIGYHLGLPFSEIRQNYEWLQG